jgi:hypothetical protein
VFFEAKICQAIKFLRVMEFEYGGGHRVVHPYCHGVTSTGHETLRAVQIDGRTRPGGLGFGKLWTVAKMSHIVVTERRFVPDDPHYNPDDSAMAVIHCRVEPAARAKSEPGRREAQPPASRPSEPDPEPQR